MHLVRWLLLDYFVSCYKIPKSNTDNFQCELFEKWMTFGFHVSELPIHFHFASCHCAVDKFHATTRIAILHSSLIANVLAGQLIFSPCLSSSPLRTPIPMIGTKSCPRIHCVCQCAEECLKYEFKMKNWIKLKKTVFNLDDYRINFFKYKKERELYSKIIYLVRVNSG